MTIKEICKDNGGQRATARLLEVDERRMRRWCHKDMMPRWALDRLGYTVEFRKVS